jgi:hypothetical protein
VWKQKHGLLLMSIYRHSRQEAAGFERNLPKLPEVKGTD